MRGTMPHHRGKTPTEQLWAMLSSMGNQRSMEQIDAIVEYGMKNQLFTEEMLKEIGSRAPTVEWAIRYAVNHRIEVVRGREAAQKAADAVGVAQQQANRADMAEGAARQQAARAEAAEREAQQQAQRAEAAESFVRMALNQGASRKPDWTGTLSAYGIKKFTPASECEKSFIQWGNQVMREAVNHRSLTSPASSQFTEE